MATRGTIPAKKAGKKVTKKVATKRKVRALQQVSKTVSELATAAMSAMNVTDTIEADVVPGARMRRMAREHLEGKGASAFVLPDRDGNFMCYGTPASLIGILRHYAPKRRLVRDSVTGLFASARAALRRPKTTTTETR